MSDSFRTMQAVSDLIHHARPLLAQHLAAVAEASGLTLRETGEAFARLRDDGFRFERDETLPLLDGLERIAITQAEGFDLAVVVLLADVLQSQTAPDALTQVWAAATAQLGNWPTTLRAAMANGLRQAKTLDQIAMQIMPSDQDYQTHPTQPIADQLLRIARSMRRDELYEVARADIVTEIENHFAALIELIGKRDGIFSEDDRWYPAEVVEMTSYHPSWVGFEGCTAILLLNALKHGDPLGVDFRWSSLGAAYCALRPSTRDPILAGIRHLYESNPEFLIFESVDLSRLSEGATIPVVDDL